MEKLGGVNEFDQIGSPHVETDDFGPQLKTIKTFNAGFGLGFRFGTGFILPLKLLFMIQLS